MHHLARGKQRFHTLARHKFLEFFVSKQAISLKADLYSGINNLKKY